MKPFEYRLKTEQVVVAGEELEIECLASLDETIDALFAHLEKGGNPSLLEELCPYFGVVWPSARALSELLLERFGRALGGKRILEVGCGLAIPSMFAARLGAKVTATDFHPEVEAVLHRNLTRNGVSGLKYIRLDWTKSNEEIGQYELVMGSDILYEKSHARDVARSVASHVSPGGMAIVADPARPYLQEFSDEMRKLGFSVQTEVRHSAGKDVFLLVFENRAQT